MANQNTPQSSTSSVDLAALIAQITAAVAALGTQGLVIWGQLQAISQLGPDATQNVINSVAAGLNADADTIATIDQWRKDHGLPEGGGLPPA